MADLTAATVKRDYLHPAMDGRALNDQQDSMLVNATPEIDCLLEYLHALPPHHFRDAAIDLVRRLIVANTEEGGCERQIAGAADQLVRELRDLELNGVSRAITAKGVARAVREPLAVITEQKEAASPDERLDAFAALSVVLREVPCAQLLSAAVRHEIGPKRFGALERIALAAAPTSQTDPRKNAAASRTRPAA